MSIFLNTVPVSVHLYSFCKYHIVETGSDGNMLLKIVTQHSEPLADISEVQVAFNTIAGWDASHSMITCTVSDCFLSQSNTVLTYCKNVVPDGYAYALNIIGGWSIIVQHILVVKYTHLHG